MTDNTTTDLPFDELLALLAVTRDQQLLAFVEEHNPMWVFEKVNRLSLADLMKLACFFTDQELQKLVQWGSTEWHQAIVMQNPGLGYRIGDNIYINSAQLKMHAVLEKLARRESPTPGDPSVGDV